MSRMFRRSVLSVMLATAAIPALADKLVVSAAASLTDAFTSLGKTYEQAHSGTKVVMNFAGTGTLLRQIERGAPVDLFASADRTRMNRAQSEQLIVANSRADFAANALVLIAPSDSKLVVKSLDNPKQEAIRRIALSNPDSVPVFRYSKLALEEGELWEALAHKYINTQHVRQSLDYVARGEVDVGFVYATDARVMDDKVRVLMRVATTEPISYPIAVVADSRYLAEAQRFVDFVRSAQAKIILRRYGFDTPP